MGTGFCCSNTITIASDEYFTTLLVIVFNCRLGKPGCALEVSFPRTSSAQRSVPCCVCHHYVSDHFKAS